MSLQKTVIAIFCIVGFCILVATFTINLSILQSSFVTLENQNFRKDTERLVNTLNDKIDSFAGTTSDWAFWDDAYAFAGGSNPSYISNLAPSSFKSLHLDAILVLDVRGNLIYGEAYNFEEDREMPIPADLLAYVSGSELLKFPAIANSEKGVSGIINLPKNPVMISSYAILPSSEAGPPRGALIMARIIDDAEISLLSKQTLLPVTIKQMPVSNPNAEFLKFSRQLSTEAPIYVASLDSHTIAGYAVVNDINGKPAFVFRTEGPRAIYEEGQRSIYKRMVFSTAAILISAFIGLFFL